MALVEPWSRVVPSLYTLCSAAVNYDSNYDILKDTVELLPDSILFDLLYQLYLKQKLVILKMEYSRLEIFERLLKITDKRLDLLRSFQAVTTDGVAVQLASVYEKRCHETEHTGPATDRIINLGLRLGGFLSEAGWYQESERVLLACQEPCKRLSTTPHGMCRLLECCHKLLHSQTTFCNFIGAQVTYTFARAVIARLKAEGVPVNLAGLFKEFSVLHFSRSQYNEAYQWAIAALKYVSPSLPEAITIEVFRQLSKSCVVKRDFKTACLMARQAMCLTRKTYDKMHPKYSASLLDYGFFLINYDSIRQSVAVYKMALDIREALYGACNIHVAMAHEELAYALYVQEYSSGRFLKAREHADSAIRIMEKVLPVDHLMLASIRRVKALILEEIALDTMINNSGMTILLKKAEDLHLSALKLAMSAFGERNVQTAKHFGNLGRLYQSMNKYQEAEAMHLKAIAIKEELLGRDDYEVGLSVGHLASLYNYHMKKHRKAEELYHRSVGISLKLFGECYSGLEYDYRGLIHVYHKLGDIEKMAEYSFMLNNWKLQREIREQQVEDPIDFEEEPLPVSVVTSIVL